MSIDTHFLRQPNSMPQRNTKNSSKPESESTQPAEDSAWTSPDANNLFDSTLRLAITKITDNILKVINEKLIPLSQMLQQFSERFDSHEKRIAEVEHCISAVEDAISTAKANWRHWRNAPVSWQSISITWRTEGEGKMYALLGFLRKLRVIALKSF